MSSLLSLISASGDVPDAIAWLQAHGAPAPIIVATTTQFQAGPIVPNGLSWTIQELTFAIPGREPHKAMMPFDPTIALEELRRLGIAPAGPAAEYTPPGNQPPPPPQPIDEVVGIPDKGHPGMYCPGEKASAQLMFAYSLADLTYTSTGGRKFRTVLLNPGSMFGTYVWCEVV
jgi:hypothetical protein